MTVGKEEAASRLTPGGGDRTAGMGSGVAGEGQSRAQNPWQSWDAGKLKW